MYFKHQIKQFLLFLLICLNVVGNKANRNPFILHDMDDESLKQGVLLYDRYKSIKDPCFDEAINLLIVTCSKLNSYLRVMLASFLMNCQLNSSGRETYFANYTCSDIRSCIKVTETYLKNLSHNDSTSELLALYLTHTNNICYYINSDKWNEQYGSQLDSLSRSSEEILKNLIIAHQQNYDLFLKQNTSRNISQKFGVITNKTFSFIKNSSVYLVETMTNLNISVSNLKIFLLDNFGLFLKTFDHWDKLLRNVLWQLHKYSGILFFSGMFMYVVLITHITNTKYTRTRLMMLLSLLFILDACIVLFVIKNQPLVHLKKYIVLVRILCVIVINVSWLLLHYYIPKWSPYVNAFGDNYVVDVSNESQNRYWNLEQSLNAALDIKQAQKNAMSILNRSKNKKKSKYQSQPSSSYESDDDPILYVTGMEKLPRPTILQSTTNAINQTMNTSTSNTDHSRGFFQNAIDSIKLISSANRIFGSRHQSFATSTVLREASNKKPLSPQMSRHTSINDSYTTTSSSLAVDSPTTFKIPLKDALANVTDKKSANNHPATTTTTTTTFYGNNAKDNHQKIPSPTKPTSVIGSHIDRTSAAKKEMKKKVTVKRKNNRATSHSDIDSEFSNDTVDKVPNTKTKKKPPNQTTKTTNSGNKSKDASSKQKNSQPPSDTMFQNPLNQVHIFCIWYWIISEGCVLLSQDLMSHSNITHNTIKYLGLSEEKMCWKLVNKALEHDCQEINDYGRAFLALHITKCFLEDIGRNLDLCLLPSTFNSSEALKHCTSKLNDSIFKIYSIFSTHVVSYCFYQKQLDIRKKMESITNNLKQIESNSLSIVQKSIFIQNEIINIQNEAMEQQKQTLREAYELDLLIKHYSTEVDSSYKFIIFYLSEIRQSIEGIIKKAHNTLKPIFETMYNVFGEMIHIDTVYFYLSIFTLSIYLTWNYDTNSARNTLLGSLMGTLFGELLLLKFTWLNTPLKYINFEMERFLIVIFIRSSYVIIMFTYSYYVHQTYWSKINTIYTTINYTTCSIEKINKNNKLLLGYSRFIKSLYHEISNYFENSTPICKDVPYSTNIQHYPSTRSKSKRNALKNKLVFEECF